MWNGEETQTSLVALLVGESGTESDGEAAAPSDGQPGPVEPQGGPAGPTPVTRLARAEAVPVAVVEPVHQSQEEPGYAQQDVPIHPQLGDVQVVPGLEQWVRSPAGWLPATGVMFESSDEATYEVVPEIELHGGLTDDQILDRVGARLQSYRRDMAALRAQGRLPCSVGGSLSGMAQQPSGQGSAYVLQPAGESVHAPVQAVAGPSQCNATACSSTDAGVPVRTNEVLNNGPQVPAPAVGVPWQAAFDQSAFSEGVAAGFRPPQADRAVGPQYGQYGTTYVQGFPQQGFQQQGYSYPGQGQRYSSRADSNQEDARHGNRFWESEIQQLRREVSRCRNVAHLVHHLCHAMVCDARELHAQDDFLHREVNALLARSDGARRDVNRAWNVIKRLQILVCRLRDAARRSDDSSSGSHESYTPTTPVSAESVDGELGMEAQAQGGP